MSNKPKSKIEPIRWQGDRLELLDQRKLPAHETYFTCICAEEVADAIRNMAVRGAPAIGIAAGYGIALAARLLEGHDNAVQALEKVALRLAEARPTAINLHWALARMRECTQRTGGDPAALVNEAIAIHQEDLTQNLRMGELGAALLPDDAVVMTHCNTGALATGGYGTALGVIRSAHAAGKIRQVYATETRPWLQGARLTAWELTQEGIPCTLIVDAAAGHVMASQGVDWLLVGADRVTAAGDVANKIGTYGLAVMAAEHGVKVMVVAPSSTFDLSISSGRDIPLETRPESEIWSCIGSESPPQGLVIQNPVFDVTPAKKIDAIVSELGIFSPPKESEIRAVFDAQKS
ncbi:MAG: S-methyl-5-thioribose-1-phosphate isomerase [Gammaproteobacteria bacterium]